VKNTELSVLQLVVSISTNVLILLIFCTVALYFAVSLI